MSRDQAADTYFSMSEPERIASTARYDSQYSYTPRDMGHIEGFMYGVGKSAVGMATGAAKLAAYTVSGAYDAAVTTGGLAMWGITGDPGYATNAPTVNYAANSLNAVGRSLGRYGQAVGREHSSAGLVASSTFVAESVLRNIPIAGKVGSNIADIGVNGYSVQNTISFGESTFEIGSALGLARLSGVKWTRQSLVRTGKTFWSGGSPARTAADRWAGANAGTTLEMSSAGRNLTRMTRGMSWQQARPLWVAESRNLAASASGEVHVFQSATGVSTNSIWATVEYPRLMSNPNVTNIVGHVVMSNGTVVTVP